ncbi:MAG: maltose ABC transporter substrate-binding protein [Tissierellales bacterium]|jgi:maltose-binding protein MalE|nr:maltose ABC transporter substrate-binding protein [Tissierellales bacterium]
MKMKKLFSMMMVAVLAFSLSACGQSSDNESASDNKESGSENVAEAKVELNLWEQMEPANQEYMDELIADYMKMKPNVKVVRTHYETEELRTNFQTAALAGEGPDLVYGPDDNVGIFLVSQLIQPVTNIMSEDFLAGFDQNAMDAGKMDGKYYEIPMTNGNQIAMLYNKALVKEVPEKWEDFVALAAEHQNNTNKELEKNTYGFLYNSKEPFWFVGIFNGYGGSVMDNELKPTLNTEAMIKALQFVVDVRDKYKLGEEGMDYDMPDTMFKQGKSAYILNGAWSWSAYKDAGIDLGIAPAPKLPDGGNHMTFYSSTKGFVIPEYVKDEKAVALKEFMEYVMSAENNGKYALIASEAPAVMAARELDEVKNDELQKASIATIEYTTPMPTVPQMRAIWDAMRPELEAVINGLATPEEAAANMQKSAEEGIATILNE